MKPITRTRAIKSVGLAIIVASTVLLAACSSGGTPTPTSSGSKTDADAGSPSAALIAAAKKEGTVTWYTSVPPGPNAQVAAQFTVKYGIPVVVNRGTTAVLSPLVNAETSSGKVVGDVVEVGTPGVIETWADQGVLVPQTKSTLGVLPTWPTKYNYKDTVFLQAIALFGITYNTDLAKPAPTGWKDLINPKYKGKIIMTDPRVQIGGLQLISGLEKAYGDDFLKKLAAQNPTYSGSLLDDPLAAGDDAIGVNGIRWADTDYINKGAPINDVFPGPAMGSSEQWVAQLKGSPHPNAAALFLNFLLSKDGQEATCKGQCTSVVGAPGTIPLPANYQAAPASFTPAEKTRLLALVGLQG
ncbi:MAG: extracellular solute-binding protein [Actinomycetota bacterium]